MNPRHILQIIGAIEFITLLLMLANLATIHLPEVPRVLGPVHRLAYTGTIVTAILVRGGSHRVWLLSLIPGIGGILASRVVSPKELSGV
ncbi:hypothetical protein [Nocardia alni]|uniref:hypothetical protein n=1 Tax=Nocardia alni TaxID=2815723 RepID=UPI001C22F584|nr:hypothetical protein [Nocardia alni]